MGTPERVIDALVERGARDLTVIANDTARPGLGIGKLVEAGCVLRVIASHIGTNPVTQRKMLVTRYVPPAIPVAFESENGIIGFGARPPEGMEDPDLTGAGGGFVIAHPGACSLDSTTSFALIRGGHLDMTVLGGLQVDARGRLANWMVPGRMVAGRGGAMDLVAGARRVVVAMQHSARGGSKIVKELTLPATAARRVTLVVTDMAVIEPTEGGLVLRERAPGVTVEQILAATGAPLRIVGEVPEMSLAPKPVMAGAGQASH